MPDNSSLINIVAPKFLDNALSEPAKEIGRALSNIFYLVFSPLNSPIEKIRIKQAVNLKNYEDEIKKQLSSIPEENLIEPPLSIVGPVLDASRYYIEEDDIRLMFSKLIASSMDNRNQTKPHHSFCEIIKQLSPLDAQILKSFGNVNNHPIVNYINTSSYGSHFMIENVYLGYSDIQDVDQISISMTNLQRLGIVTMSYASKLQDSEYIPFLKHEFFTGWQEVYNEINQIPYPEDLLQQYPALAKSLNSQISIEKGIVALTSYGSSFKYTCT